MKKIISLLALSVALISCNAPDKSDAMKSQVVQQRVQQFYDQVINAHNVAAIDSFVTADFVDHNPDQGHSGKGIDDLKATFGEFFTAYPDIHMKVNFFVVEGDKCAAHVTMTGTNSGMMGKMPATNKQITVDGIDIIQVKDGKATERWGIFDSMSMMKQLGMMDQAAAGDSTKKKM